VQNPFEMLAALAFEISKLKLKTQLNFILKLAMLK
jgi:hypothetical protein